MKTGFVFSVANVLLVEGEACSHVGLENLCDRVDVGCCPDVQAQIHPDNDDDEYDADCDDVDSEIKLFVYLSKKCNNYDGKLLHIANRGDVGRT